MRIKSTMKFQNQPNKAKNEAVGAYTVNIVFKFIVTSFFSEGEGNLWYFKRNLDALLNIFSFLTEIAPIINQNFILIILCILNAVTCLERNINITHTWGI